MGQIPWQTIVLAAGLIFSIVSGAIRLGVTQASVDVTSERVQRLEIVIQDLQKSVSQFSISQMEQDRRLNVIDAHDLETRSVEGRIMERVNKIEGRLPIFNGVP